MSATLHDRDAHDTLVLPDVDIPPYTEPDDGRADRPHEARPQPPRWTRGVTVVVLAALGVLIAVIAFLILPWGGTSPEPDAPPAPTPVEAPAVVPDVPTPTVEYDQEARANWDVTGLALGERLDVRTGPGAHHELLTTLPHDLAELESTGRIASVDGVLWRELVIPGDGTGWVEAAHLTETAPPPAPQQVTYGSETPGYFDVTDVASSDVLNVRTGPGTAHPVIAGLAHDATRIESTGRTARVDGALWREVTLAGGATGWVSAAFLTASPAAPQVVYGEELRGNWDVTGVPVGEVLNVYRAPGTANPIVAALAPDMAELESTGRIASVDGVPWRELVIPGDGTGWVDAAHLTETAPPPEVVYGEEPTALWDVTGVAADDTLNVRTGPGVHNPVLTTLPPDADQLESTGRIATVDGALWRELAIGEDTTGWVSAQYLTETPPPPTG